METLQLTGLATAISALSIYLILLLGNRSNKKENVTNVMQRPKVKIKLSVDENEKSKIIKLMTTSFKKLAEEEPDIYSALTSPGEGEQLTLPFIPADDQENPELTTDDEEGPEAKEEDMPEEAGNTAYARLGDLIKEKSETQQQ